MTWRSRGDLTLRVNLHAVAEFSAEQRKEVASWFASNEASLPEPVRLFLTLHCKYLKSERDRDLSRRYDAVCRELRRALGITPSSERQRSGRPLSSVPPERGKPAQTVEERLEAQLDRSSRLEGWHRALKKRHRNKAKRIRKRLSKLRAATATDREQEPLRSHQEALDEGPEVTEDTPVEDIELTPEELAESEASAREFGARLLLGNGADPAFQSVNETLMPGGAVALSDKLESLVAELPAELENATVVKTLHETRGRYDFTVSVSRIELDVEKKVVVMPNGERAVVAASTAAYGPPRYSVTWSALATLAVLVGQFALPLNRLATLVSTAEKRFSAGGLGRMLHYVAKRLVPIYLELADQLADSSIIGGDDTSCRVIEVSSYFAAKNKDKPPPWADYATRDAAAQSLERCEQMRQDRLRRRADGSREAQRTSSEEPSLGMLLGCALEFESTRQDGTGKKQSLNTTVLSGRSIAEDPRSLIVFYRSHLGGCGNLLESLLRNRNPSAREMTLQADLSTTNLVKDPELLKRFVIKLIGCSAHARRPFALYEHEDPVECSYMLHLFTGLAMHEQRLDVHGRNRDNVLAVRQTHSRELWEDIRELATEMQVLWSKSTKLGAGARYILKHYDKLTAYLDDPHLEPSNNLRERMLRTEKLIEKSSMFRRTLEGRFALDIVRTVMQTAVAAGVPVHAYLEAVLRADADEIAAHPERFTPRAFATSAADVTSA